MSHIREIRVSDIAPSTFNPPQRTTPRAIKGLLASIRRDGVLAPLHLIPVGEGKYVAVDGHRRLECAKTLQFLKVPSIIHANVELTDSARLWGSLNKSTRSVNALEWMMWWYATSGSAEKEVPSSVLGHIRLAREIFGGREGIRYLIDNHTAPTVAKQIQLLSSRLEKSSLKSIPIRQVGHWVIDQKMQSMLQPLVGTRSHMPAKVMRKLHARIVRNVPFTLLDLSTT